jgi:hypothetical protein
MRWQMYSTNTGTAALQPSIANSDSETDGENVPGTLSQSA